MSQASSSASLMLAQDVVQEPALLQLPLGKLALQQARDQQTRKAVLLCHWLWTRKWWRKRWRSLLPTLQQQLHRQNRHHQLL